MASSSFSSLEKRFKYDLFLSFRGKDTRKTFVDHLYHALQRHGIHTFKDDKRLKKGRSIDKELIEAIEDSKLFIIVFSKNYASSSWCLDELVKMIECHKTTEQIAYPLFYDVEPTDVRKQSGAFGEAFAKHKFEDSFEKWKEALKEAANLSGWELKKTADGHEAEFIKRIVEEISLELRSANFSVDETLVGMESRIKDVEILLETGVDDVRMIGIKGIGGGGKTTLARALYDKISFQFEGKSFVENVREVSRPSLTGIKLLQKQVLSDLLNDKDIIVNSVSDGKNMMKKMLRSRKVLIVLDDVDHLDQLQALAGGPSWFMVGSTIIITTRDEQVLVAHGVKLIHNVNLLSDKEANCLLSRYAFGRDTPIQGYEELSREIVSYVVGLPLTTKVLGSFLCGKDELEWIDTLKRLEKFPERETMQILELSFKGLEDDYKEVFLNVACFMEAWIKDDAIQVLECCGFHARTVLKVLEQKSLITTFHDDFDRECIGIHDLIKEMGRNIVRRFSPDEPSTHSRLWISEEIKDILANGLAAKAKYIDLGLVEFLSEIYTKGFRKMEKLIFLNISIDVSIDCFSDNGTYSEVWSSLPCIPNSLRYLRWDGYRHSCLPNSFQPNNLVGLIMRDSGIEYLWDERETMMNEITTTWDEIEPMGDEGETKVMKKLKFLDLSNSMLKKFDLKMTPNLERLYLRKCGSLQSLNGCHLNLKSLYVSRSHLHTLNLRMAQNLETLDLSSCSSLFELSLPKCPNLVSVDLSGLSQLREINLELTPNLESLYLVECPNLLKFHRPVVCSKLKFLTLRLSTFTTLDLGLALNLEKLCLENCHNLVEFQALMTGCPKLKSLKISNTKLKALNLGAAQNLVELYLEKCPDMVELYMPISCLKLRSIDLNLSKLRTLELGLIPSLQIMRLAHCRDLLKINMPYGCQNLKKLYLQYSKLKTLHLELELTTNLEVLDLRECAELVVLKMPVNGYWSKLTHLYATHLNLRTLDLRLTPNLNELNLDECDVLEELHMPINGCSKLTKLYLRCLKLRTLNLQFVSDLESLDIKSCDSLVEIHMPVEYLKLKFVSIHHSMLRNIDLGLASDLERLDIENCHNLVEIRMPVECLKLKFVSIHHSMLRNLDIGMASDLVRLDIENCHNLVDIHMPVKCLKLKFVSIHHSMLKNLDLGLAPNLLKLDIFQVWHGLVQHHAPVGCVKGLECIDISGRSRLKSFQFSKISMWGSHRVSLSAESIDICPLDTDHRLPSFRFSSHYEEQQQPSLTTINLEKVVSLAHSCLRNFTNFSESICGLKNLRKLTLHGNVPEMPNHFEHLEYLEELVLSSIDTKYLPDSICMLKLLKSLKLESCSLLEKLPDDIGRLECLEDLIVNECTSLTDIPISICEMKRLRKFFLAFCAAVKRLPEQLGGLQSLQQLNVKATSIVGLPGSISLLKYLKYLTLESCWLLEKLPDDIGRLECLEVLILNKCTMLTDIPISICDMKRLRYLSLTFCTRVKNLPEELGQLQSLKDLNLEGTCISQLPDSIYLLKDLRITGSAFLQSRGLADSLLVNNTGVRAVGSTSVLHSRGSASQIIKRLR